MVVACVICKENISKYKCSACFSPYCSINCWKEHKSKDNCKVTCEENVKDVVCSRRDEKKYFTEDTVSEEKLNQLSKSKTLKNILSSRYLQSTLIALDNASNPEKAIKEAMKDSEFVEFVNICLKTVEDVQD